MEGFTVFFVFVHKFLFYFIIISGGGRSLLFLSALAVDIVMFFYKVLYLLSPQFHLCASS